MAFNAALASIKILAGFFRNTYALTADAIESTSDIIASLVVWGGLRVSAAPADERHPYGYGKAEALSGRPCRPSFTLPQSSALDEWRAST